MRHEAATITHGSNVRSWFRPIYSDEILHAALLRHDRVANQLITQEIRRLYRSIVETIHNAVKHRGVSLDQISDVFGEPGGYDEYLEVYGKRWRT